MNLQKAARRKNAVAQKFWTNGRVDENFRFSEGVNMLGSLVFIEV